MDTALSVAFIIIGIVLFVFKGLLGAVLVNGTRVKRRYRCLFIVLGLGFALLGLLELIGAIDFFGFITRIVWE